jgi:hypothetical protein
MAGAEEEHKTSLGNALGTKFGCRFDMWYLRLAQALEQRDSLVEIVDASCHL